jgi:hypothetical protein
MIGVLVSFILYLISSLSLFCKAAVANNLKSVANPKTRSKKVTPMASFQVPYTPAKNQRDKKAQLFFRDEAIHVPSV